MASVLDPFLKRAINFAILHKSGNVDVWMDRFIICVRGPVIISAPSLIKVPESVSIPGALDMFVFYNISSIMVESIDTRFRVLEILNWL